MPAPLAPFLSPSTGRGEGRGGEGRGGEGRGGEGRGGEGRGGEGRGREGRGWGLMVVWREWKWERWRTEEWGGGGCSDYILDTISPIKPLPTAYSVIPNLPLLFIYVCLELYNLFS